MDQDGHTWCDEDLTPAGLRVAGPPLLHHPFTQVRLLRGGLTGPSPCLYSASTVAATLCPLAPNAPAT